MFSSWYFVFILVISIGIVVISANEEESQQSTRFSRTDRGDFRPLQFGKRDSSFRPLQFGKKNDYRPLQFGKRSFHPYAAVYSPFNNDLVY